MWNAVSWLFGALEHVEGTPSEKTENGTVIGTATATVPTGAKRTRAIRWGFIGLGETAWDVAECVASQPDCEIVAVTGADPARSSLFSGRFGAEVWAAAEGEGEPARVDAAYVSGPLALRRQHCLQGLGRGWHIIVESPLALNEREAEDIVRLAKLKSLLLLEAIPGRFCPASSKLEEVLSKGAIGQVRVVRVEGSARAGAGEGEGAVVPLGAWALAFAAAACGRGRAAGVQAAGDDSQVAMSLRFPGGQLASICCSTAVNLPGDAHIYGTAGSISVSSPFWQPHKFTVHRNGDGAKEGPSESEYSFPMPSPRRGAADSGQLESSLEMTESSTGESLSPGSSESFYGATTSAHREFGQDGGDLNFLFLGKSEGLSRGNFSSRVSDDGSLRGWVQDLGEMQSSNLGSPEETDNENTSEGEEVDLGQAAAQAIRVLGEVVGGEGSGGLHRQLSIDSRSSTAGTGGGWGGEGGMSPFGRGGREGWRRWSVRSASIFMVQEVLRCLREGLRESPRLRPAESVELARMLAAVRAHLGQKSLAETSHVRIASLSDWADLRELK